MCNSTTLPLVDTQSLQGLMSCPMAAVRDRQGWVVSCPQAQHHWPLSVAKMNTAAPRNSATKKPKDKPITRHHEWHIHPSAARSEISLANTVPRLLHGEFFLDVLVKGVAYPLVKYGWYLGRKSPDPDGWRVVLMGLVFWTLAIWMGYHAYRVVALHAHRIAA